jgi:hypothetical protein
VTVSDETGWEFDTAQRIYANLGLDKNGEKTLVAWKIVKQAPSSTALRAEEIREEKLLFQIQPQDGKRFTIHASMRYFFAPSPQAGFGQEPQAPEMAKATLTIPGMRPS